LTTSQRRQLLQELLDDVLGLGPLEPLLRDPTISDILVNGPHQVYVERGGVLEETPVRFRDNDHLLEVIYRIVSWVGKRVDESSPIVDARLPDGSRVNAIIPPLSLRGPALSIRRFSVQPFQLADLLRFGTLAPEMAQFLEAAVKARLSLIISGGTGTGKTTLMNVLSGFIPNHERIISVEDAAELQLQQRHVLQLETRPPNIEGTGAVTMRELVRNTLRMRPSRIIIGECRGAEALDMLQAMNTGHEGSMTTLHANSPRDALSRLEMMLLMNRLEAPLRALREQIASAVNLIVQMERQAGGARRITNITEVVGMDREMVMIQDLFIFRKQGVDAGGQARGHFESTGIPLRCRPRLEAAGIRLPDDLFRSRVLGQI
jgi:pilus assembly protein CpaF